MDAANCILSRRSIKKYLNKPLEFDKLTMILEAGCKAPSSGNLQDFRFIVVTDRDKIESIANHCSQQYWIADAGALIVVLTDTELAEAYYGLRGQRLYSIQNAAAAIENMLLMAHALGLGACWIGAFDETYIMDFLGISDGIRPQAIISIGYPAGEPEKKTTNPLASMVYFNMYGESIKNVNAMMNEYNKEIEKVLKSTNKKSEDIFKKLKEHTKKFMETAKEELKKSK